MIKEALHRKHRLTDAKTWKQIEAEGIIYSEPPVVLGSLTTDEIDVFKRYVGLGDKRPVVAFNSFPEPLISIKDRMLSLTLAKFPIAKTHIFDPFYRYYDKPRLEILPHPDRDFPPRKRRYRKGLIKSPDDFIRTTVAGSLGGDSSGPWFWPGNFLIADVWRKPLSEMVALLKDVQPVKIPEFTIVAHRGFSLHSVPPGEESRGLIAITATPLPKSGSRY